MNLLSAHQALKALAPAFSTKEASDLFGISVNHAATLLARLEKQKTIVRLTRGRWAYSSEVDILLLPSILTYPALSYVSLYTALYYHGLIEQIPSQVFAISTGKTKLFHTPLSTVSIHHMQSTLFAGYELHGKDSVLMASPEKALFDTLYLASTKARGFSHLTELEIPRTFQWVLLDAWVNDINNKGHRSSVVARLNRINDIKRHHR